MLTLQPFQKITQMTTVRAFATRTGSMLNFEFELSDPEDEVLDFPSVFPYPKDSWSRADNLWRTTCFEAFVGVPEQECYWEFNFSPASRAWNVYRFDGYRRPQPPRASAEWELVSADLKNGKMSFVVNPKMTLVNLECSLTAVLRFESGPAYFALKHAGVKPDFHERLSFTFQI